MEKQKYIKKKLIINVGEVEILKNNNKCWRNRNIKKNQMLTKQKYF